MAAFDMFLYSFTADMCVDILPPHGPNPCNYLIKVGVHISCLRNIGTESAGVKPRLCLVDTLSRYTLP